MCLSSERPEDISDFSDCRSQINHCYDDEDIVITSSNKQKRRPAKPKPRKRAPEISLEFHWRLDVHKILVLSVRWIVLPSNENTLYCAIPLFRTIFDVTYLSNVVQWSVFHLQTDPLSKAVAQLSLKLKVPPSKILLMRNDDELPVCSTITQLGLGNADIIGE